MTSYLVLANFHFHVVRDGKWGVGRGPAHCPLGMRLSVTSLTRKRYLTPSRARAAAPLWLWLVLRMRCLISHVILALLLARQKPIRHLIKMNQGVCFSVTSMIVLHADPVTVSTIDSFLVVMILVTLSFFSVNPPQFRANTTTQLFGQIVKSVAGRTVVS